MTSPWERVLSDDIARLDPTLKSYFSAIPPGFVGKGSGVFDVVGTPRRWLWPILFVMGTAGIAFPVWQRSVPFAVMNEPTPHGTIRAHRTFHFRGGTRVMTDEVGITSGGLADRLGPGGMLVASLAARVVEGRLELRSTGMTVRLGAVRLPLGKLSPVVTLIERSLGDRQHVALTIDAGIVGRIYEYSGSFTYRIESRD